MKIFNSLSKTVEEFVPVKKGHVGMYACGPTVYDYDHIGHGRKYVMDDLLRRTLTYNGLEVKHVQNITDVGHLSSDADEGEDKLAKGAAKYKKTVWEVAEFFTAAHFASMDLLNVLRPDVSCKATEHILEQIALVQKLLDKGFAYETPEAVYFSVQSFPRYGQLFGQNVDDKLVAARSEVQTGTYKKAPADFALWFKAVGNFADHAMQWDSPWGRGFPGWHIECSAMAMKYLGESFDIHTGGEDHLPIHHPNEIAQSEAATGKPFVKYWVHYAFLTVDGTKMSKSLGNVYRVEDVVEKGFAPLALRYFYMSANYRTPLNFTWSSLASAQTAYEKLKNFVSEMRSKTTDIRVNLSPEKLKKIDVYRQKFSEAINNDLNFPQALASVWEMLKSNIADYDKLDLLLAFDEVLGLDLASVGRATVSEEVKTLVQKRESLRRDGRFVEADGVRMQIEEMGYTIKDTAHGTTINSK